MAPELDGWMPANGVYVKSLHAAVIAAHATTGSWVLTGAKRMRSYLRDEVQQGYLCIRLVTQTGRDVLVAVPQTKVAVASEPPTVYIRRTGQRPNPVHMQLLVDNLTTNIRRILRAPTRRN